MGKSGAGKGTQAEQLMNLLTKKDPSTTSLHVETGNELRKLIKENNFTAERTRDIIDNGGLMPTFMPVYLWTKVMKDVFTGKENLFFDGTPRRLLEAHALKSLFPFYGLDKPWVIYLDVKHEEAHKRLKLRARNDDEDEKIRKRHQWFDADVMPIIEFYRNDPDVRFLDIDGERTIEEIHADIVKRVGLE